MANYITVSIDLDALKANSVVKHVEHYDGTTTWRIEGQHDPLYLNGSPEGLARFSESLRAAVEVLNVVRETTQAEDDATQGDPREKGDDDGREYGDPRDARSER